MLEQVILHENLYYGLMKILISGRERLKENVNETVEILLIATPGYIFYKSMDWQVDSLNIIIIKAFSNPYFEVGW